MTGDHPDIEDMRALLVALVTAKNAAVRFCLGWLADLLIIMHWMVTEPSSGRNGCLVVQCTYIKRAVSMDAYSLTHRSSM